MLRTLYISVWIVLVTIFFAMLAILVSFFDGKGNMPHIIARTWARSILWAARIQVTVTGFSNIDPQKSYIFMSNHQGNFDIPVLLAFLTAQFRWLAKAELFKIPLFGYAMKRAGYISIDRSNRKSAFESLSRAAAIIKNGVSVIIFPEGTRSQDGKIRPFKQGGFLIAIDAGAPIVPVIIHGTRSIMPKNKFRINPGNVDLEILQPIQTDGYTRKQRDELLDKVRNSICQSFESKEKGRSEC